MPSLLISDLGLPARGLLELEAVLAVEEAVAHGVGNVGVAHEVVPLR